MKKIVLFDWIVFRVIQIRHHNTMTSLIIVQFENSGIFILA